MGETEFQAQQPAALGSEQFPVFFAAVEETNSVSDEDQYRNLCAHLNNSRHHICMVSPYLNLSCEFLKLKVSSISCHDM